MDKKHYVLKSFPSRPTFMQDMTEEERTVMHEHIAYWTDKAEKGIAIVFGPVFDPKGGYGLGIIEVENEDEVHNLIKDDPAVKSGIQRTEFYPMRAVLPKWWQTNQK
ncbi:YciI family protein [Clostridium sp.]|uniref:YciI family protein n=1 Tax=Clostridium sp. TaxID=1506 RepID=UPI00283AECEB|nr:YciI family protein [Clostridium sp.]MDR3595647.1 YciI family protein [Clostridium sp.]